jgi:glutathione S-transferase
VLLYDSAISGNCYKVRLLCAHLGLALERREVDVVDRSQRPQILGGLNPALRVPTLVLDDGRPLGESSAILWYLAEGTPYLPADAYERAQALQWMCFEQYSHEPNVAVVRFWVKYAAEKPGEDEVAARRATGQVALAAMEDHLASHAFFVGERYSIADIALYAYVHCAEDAGAELAPHEAITAWLRRVEATPRFENDLEPLPAHALERPV